MQKFVFSSKKVLGNEFDIFFDNWKHQYASENKNEAILEKLNEIRNDYITGKIFCLWVKTRNDGPVIGAIFYHLSQNELSISTICFNEESNQNIKGSNLISELVQFLVKKFGIQRVTIEFCFIESQKFHQMLVDSAFLPFIRVEMKKDINNLEKVKFKQKNIQYRQINWKTDTNSLLAEIGFLASKNSPDSIIDKTFADQMKYTEFLNIIQKGHLGKKVEIFSWVAEDTKNNTIIGYVLSGSIEKESGHVLDIAVTPEYQQKGTGRHLLKLSLGSMSGLGLKNCKLEVIETNTAYNLYLGLGFKEIKKRYIYIWDQNISLEDIPENQKI
ncbi:MAG: GNAT family N-acetyltransferase [Candidatus Ranarchaeia archaeon]